MATALTAEEAEDFRRLYGEDINTTEQPAPVYQPSPAARRRPNRRCSVTEHIIRQQQDYERVSNQWTDPSIVQDTRGAPQENGSSWVSPVYESKDDIYPIKDENSLFSQINYKNTWDPNGSNPSMDFHGLNTPRSGRKYTRAGAKSVSSRPDDFPDPWAPRAKSAVPEDFPDPWGPRAA